MTATKLGAYVYALGLIAMALVCLAWRDFDFGQPVPSHFPGRTALAVAAAAFMLIAGAAILWRRTAAWGGAALAVYFTLIVVIVMNGRIALVHYAEFGTWSGAAEQLAVAMGALIVATESARIDAARAARLTRVAQMIFGVCAVLFGLAHFVYLDLTVPLVPRWLPPSQLFWAYATGIGQIAAGVAILVDVQARLAMILLTVMYVSFGVLVHAPLAFAHPFDHYVLSENALNLALTGVAWIMADSLGWGRRET